MFWYNTTSLKIIYTNKTSSLQSFSLFSEWNKGEGFGEKVFYNFVKTKIKKTLNSKKDKKPFSYCQYHSTHRNWEAILLFCFWKEYVELLDLPPKSLKIKVLPPSQFSILLESRNDYCSAYSKRGSDKAYILSNLFIAKTKAFW